MSDFSRPCFGGKLRIESYYDTIKQAIRALRHTVTNREIARRLNAREWTTPSGLPWTRQRVATFIKNSNI